MRTNNNVADIVEIIAAVGFIGGLTVSREL